ncbi:polyprotein [megrivirus D1]|uniref:Genome polyprotein n=1 Tax=megrivirus D1 TaxID=2870375 RepID=A0A1X9VLI8_9PICO|nr:polyprotein [megrivirus D1]ARR73563.1 polyprotein [megrivirus D1]
MEDNTPLQAQAEDQLTKISRDVRETSETNLVASTPAAGIITNDSGFERVVNLDACLPTLVSSFTWTSTAAIGDILTTWQPNNEIVGTATSNQSPIPLPHALVIQNSTGFGDVNAGNNRAVGIFGVEFVRHALYRTDYVVTISTNGTIFHSGSLMAVAVPLPHVWFQQLTGTNPDANRSWTMNDILSLNQLGIFPSARLLPRSNSSVSLSLPHPGPMEHLPTSAMDLTWAVVVFVESKLKFPHTTVPSLNVLVEVTPQRAAFYGPRAPQQVYARLGSFRDQTTNPVPASEVESILEGRTNVNPGVGTFYTLSPQAIGNTYATTSRSLSFLPPRVESWHSVLSIPTLHSFFELSTTYQQGTPLFMMAVSPTANLIRNYQTNPTMGSIKVVVGNTFLANFVRYFTQWRGAIQYTLEHTGAAITAGRIILGYLPGARLPWKAGQEQPHIPTNLTAQLMNSPHIIWDLSNSTTATFTAPFAAGTTWANVTLPDYTSQITTQSSSGVLAAAILQPIVTTAANAQSLDLLMHVSAGPDFRVRFPAPVPILNQPIFNGVLDQGPEVGNLAPGERFVDEDDVMDLRNFFQQSRLYRTGITTAGGQGSITAVPLSLVTYAPSQTPATSRENAFGVFTSLFTLIRGDLLITVTTELNTSMAVSYRPPGATLSVISNTATSALPKNEQDLFLAPTTITSLRADNTAVQIRVPFPHFAPVWTTSNSRTARGDVRYKPETSQFDPGDLGTLFIAIRGQATTQTPFRVFLAIENGSFFIPRPFGPTTTTQVQPQGLLDEILKEHTALELSAALFSTLFRDDCWQRFFDSVSLDSLPWEYPEGIEWDGEWIDGEWYSLPLPGQLIASGQILRRWVTHDPTFTRAEYVKAVACQRLLAGVTDMMEFKFWAEIAATPRFEGGNGDVYYYRVNRGTYMHYGIGCGEDTISLVQVGMRAVVSRTNESAFATFLGPLPRVAWLRATSMLGHDFGPYNLHRNCSTFVEACGAPPVVNTGKWLFAGLAVAATGITIASLFQGQQPIEEVPKESYHPSPEHLWARKVLRTLRVETAVANRPVKYHPKRCVFYNKNNPFSRVVPAWFEGPISVNVVNPAIEASATMAATETATAMKALGDQVPIATAQLAQAAASVVETSNNMNQFISRLDAVIYSTVEGLKVTLPEALSEVATGVACQFASIVLKFISMALIIFGNPNPSTIAGVLGLIIADLLVLSPVRRVVINTAKTLSAKMALFVSEVLNLGCPNHVPRFFDEVDTVVENFDPDYQEYMNERREASFEGLDDFNKSIQAMKNVDWVVGKIKEIIEWAVNLIRHKQAANPKEFLAKNGNYINTLYKDSIQTASCQNVDRDLLKKRMEETKDLLDYAVIHNVPSATNILSRTLSNYNQTDRKLIASENNPRPEPLVVYIHGVPGVGKSILSNVISSAYCHKHGLKLRDSVYSQPPSSEFFDGYTGQPVHVLDDFCQNTDGEDVKTFCQMVSTVRFTPPMASLEEKGVNYCSKLILATSNMASPHSNEIRTPVALERRCYFKVKTILNPDFAADGVLDVHQAFQNVGPAKKPYFKYDTPYFNGSAVTFLLSVGGRYESQSLDAYQLMDRIFEELTRRETTSSEVMQALFEAPGVLPHLCKDLKNCFENCRRIHFSNDSKVWHQDFPTVEDKNKFVRSHYPDTTGVKAIRTCPCSDPYCGKIQLDDKPFIFPSRSIREAFLYEHGDLPREREPFFVPTVKEKCLYERVEQMETVTKFSIAATVLSAIGSLVGLVVYFLRRKKDVEEQGPYSGLPKGKPAPTFRKIKHKTVSYEGGLPQIYSKINANCFSIHFVSANPYSLTALGLKENMFVTNHHALAGATKVECFGRSFDVEDLKPERLVRGEDPTDLVLCKLPIKSHTFKDITRFLPRRKDKYPVSEAILLSRTNSLPLNVSALDLNFGATTQVGDLTFPKVISYKATTMSGLCGSPLVTVLGPRERILGIHFAGTGSVGFSCPLYYEDILPEFEGIVRKIATLEKPLHIPRRTTLRPSPAYGAFPIEKGPAPLTNRDPRLDEGVNLDDSVFSKHAVIEMRTGREHRPIQGEQNYKFCEVNDSGWRNLEAGMEYVVSKIMKNLGVSKFEPVSVLEAVNGYGFMDGMDMGQSPGYPRNAQGVSRRSCFDLTPEGWMPTEELMAEVDKALKDPSDFYFSTFLKDELRGRDKIAVGGTRIVDGDALPRIIAMRVVFSQFFEKMLVKNGPEVFSAVGCNPDISWTLYYHHFSRFKNCFDIDYKAFDSTQPKKAFELMAKALKPYFSVDPTPYIMSLACSKHIFGDTVYEMEGGMPSGCVGTSIFNSINNSAFIASAILSMGMDPEDFSWICYGDDVIIGSDVDGLPQKIADFYHAETCLRITPASKSGSFPEVSTLADVTFLKRGFQPDSSETHLIHPVMDQNALEQSVMWMTDGPFQQKFDSLCLLAYHGGRKAYEEFVDAVVEKCRTRGEIVVAKPFSYLMTLWYSLFFR